MPDYTRPGDNGVPVPESFEWQVEGRTPLPSPLACGKWYAVEASVSQTVWACDDDVKVEPLYNRAEELARYLVAVRADCDPVDCPTMEVVLEAYWWGCRGFVAFATVRMAVHCSQGLNPAVPPLSPVDGPQPSDFEDLHRLEDLPRVPFEATNYLVEIVPLGQPLPSLPLPCPSARTLRYTHRERLTGRCPPADFKPAVDRGLDEVQSYGRTFGCAGPCERVVQIGRVQWLCYDPPLRLRGIVEVTVYFELLCRKPAPPPGGAPPGDE